MTTVSSPSTPAANSGPSLEADVFSRAALLLLLISAAVWFVVASACGLICSIKFHSPNFLADPAWLTYGRLRPAAGDAMLYGACVQAGMGVALWLFARLGRTPLLHPLLVFVGACLWNCGVTVGVAGILLGDSTGFENLELPRYSSLIMFIGYLLLGLCGALTYHRRREFKTFVSQWFLFTALFWFPWLYSTAELLLVGFPVRGAAQAVIMWWYSQNLLVVWFGLVGLAVSFYFLPALTNRPLHSRYLALFTFWMLILFGSWGGIPNTASVPAWLPAISTIANVMMLLTLVAVALNAHSTLAGSYGRLRSSLPLKFITFGVAAFLVSGFMRVLGFLPGLDQELHFTWFASAQSQLQVYGFFAMVMFGAVYAALPQLAGAEFPFPKLVSAHFWLSAVGIAFLVVPLAIGGVMEAMKLGDSRVAFVDIMKSTMPFLRASTVGDLLLVTGNLFLLANLIGLSVRSYRGFAVRAFTIATVDLYKPAEVKA